MRTRALMWVLLVVVAGAAAVLSFSALRDLALACGFRAWTAPLLPVVVDAGCAAGTLAWLGQPGGPARVFGRVLALGLLVGSVAGNALGHALAAYRLAPAWPVVVAVSAVAPAVLAGVVHLAALMAQAHTEPPVWPGDALDDPTEDDRPLDPWVDAPYADTPTGRAAELIDAGVGRRRLATELGISEYQARQILAQRDEVAR